MEREELEDMVEDMVVESEDSVGVAALEEQVDLLEEQVDLLEEEEVELAVVVWEADMVAMDRITT